ncbi:hypothetical protein Pcinc_041995 [Petrolisthes cinctipes]|uniref:Coatomer subunit delta n=2 Tax=Petrolisthes cinctipes TaxID=88211 RepID=A0AAE1BJ34_PETCI|nr:hypothetical protein Pcinc_041995 [Petrolisthes cinctipes]
MVLLAACVCTKGGKALVSRQFVEMSKSRIEGLLAAFPKLMSSGRQHTFVETESIPEYCRTMDESEILDNSFNLIFAFDEIVALGYRESVNLAQIRTFVEMDSHEEKVYRAVRETQEREARTKSKEKAKELQRKRTEEMKRSGGRSITSGGINNTNNNSGGFGVSGGFGGVSSTFPVDAITTSTTQDTRSPSIKSSSNKAMKLGGKARDVDSFVDQLKSEGEKVTSSDNMTHNKTTNNTPDIDMEPIHIVMSEEIVLHAGRDGGLQNMEIQGILKLRITDSDSGFIKIQVENTDTRPIQIQTHPNVDRELWKTKGQIGMKMNNKPFPHNTDVGVLKWRFHTVEDSFVPLSINCWPQDNGSGGCDVNIEYNLETNVFMFNCWPQDNGSGGCDVNIEYNLENITMELNEVVITIPLALGSPSPLINECEATGTLDFTARGIPDNFFPVCVSFTSSLPYCGLKVLGVVGNTDGAAVNFSQETLLKTNTYEIN